MASQLKVVTDRSVGGPCRRAGRMSVRDRGSRARRRQSQHGRDQRDGTTGCPTPHGTGMLAAGSDAAHHVAPVRYWERRLWADQQINTSDHPAVKQHVRRYPVLRH